MFTSPLVGTGELIVLCAMSRPHTLPSCIGGTIRVMKALSLRQPWAHLVVYGARPWLDSPQQKDLENRRWNTKFRGVFLVHAAQAMTGREFHDALGFATRAASWSNDEMRKWNEHFTAYAHRGGIVGQACVVSVISPHGPREPCIEPWHMHHQYGFGLAQIRVLPFVACGGRLGFFEVPAAILVKLKQKGAVL